MKEAAQAAFFLPPDNETSIDTYIGDARNVIADLVGTGEFSDYDIVYLDAFNDYSVPFHLTTFEFNEQVKSLLADDGIYIQNLIDIFANTHGRFIGAYIATLHETFDYVYVFGTAEQSPTGGRETFIVAAANHPLDAADIGERSGDYETEMTLVAMWEENEQDFVMKNMMRHDRAVILTDNYAPVDNLVSGLYFDN